MDRRQFPGHEGGSNPSGKRLSGGSPPSALSPKTGVHEPPPVLVGPALPYLGRVPRRLPLHGRFRGQRSTAEELEGVLQAHCVPAAAGLARALSDLNLSNIMRSSVTREELPPADLSMPPVVSSSDPSLASRYSSELSPSRRSTMFACCRLLS